MIIFIFEIHHLPLSLLLRSLHQLLDERLYNLRRLRGQRVLQRGFFPQIWTQKGVFYSPHSLLSSLVYKQWLKGDSVLFSRTCGEARVLSCPLRDHQGQIAVDPPLHGPDHVALCALQQSVNLNHESTFQGFSEIWRREAVIVQVGQFTCQISTSTADAPGGGGREWLPEIKSSYSRCFPSCWAKALIPG